MEGTQTKPSHGSTKEIEGKADGLLTNSCPCLPIFFVNGVSQRRAWLLYQSRMRLDNDIGRTFLLCLQP